MPNWFRSSSSRRNGGEGSSRCSNPHGGFLRANSSADDRGKKKERDQFPISGDTAAWLARTYTPAPDDVKMPDDWHLNPNRVPVPPPPRGRERATAIAEHVRLALPEMLADPRYAANSAEWDRVFEHEHEMRRRSFFSLSPPRWFTRESVSPPNPEDAAKCDEDLYVRLPEERFPCPGIPLRVRAPSAPKPVIITAGTDYIFID